MPASGHVGAVTALSSESAMRAMREGVDLRLVERCQAGDIDAYCELVSRYRDRVLNFIHRSVRDHSVAEDLAQDVFIRAFANIRKFRRRASFQTWLFRIAHNRMIDHNRRTRRRRKLWALSLDAPAHDPDVTEVSVPDERMEPSRVVADAELGRRIEDAVRALSDKLRAVVVLFDVEGLAYHEIAEVLGCPVGTVKSRLFNARAELRRRLGPYLACGESDGGGDG